MGLTEIALILFVALVLFGPEDLPVIARTLGKIFYQFRKYTTELTKEFQAAIDSPANVINDALMDNKSKNSSKTEAKKEEESESEEEEELLSYEDIKEDGIVNNPDKDTNPLADLPSNVFSHTKDTQAGE